MIDGLTVGAYAAAPKRTPLDAAGEDRWYALLGELDHVSGIEVFFRGSLHPQGAARFARLLPPGWHVVATLLPQAIAGQAADPAYGLASDSPEGRRAAVAHARELLGELREIADILGHDPVLAVELHSAPRPDPAAGVRSSAAALSASLEELAAAVKEHGLSAELVVEHCDALRPGQPPVKGYLGLDDEIRAVRAAQAARAADDGAPRFGQAVNWGRSAIEGRSSTTPVEHVAALDRAGTLSGLMFSGAPGADGPLGAAWDDVHDPLVSDDPASLLTTGEIGRTLGALGPQAVAGLRYLGVKVQDPADTDDLDRRLDPLRAVLAAVHTEWMNRP